MNDIQISNDAYDTIKHRLHQDLVYDNDVRYSDNLQMAYLQEARGVTPNNLGPKSIDQLKNEHKKLQQWGAKFAGANKILQEEVENLREEIQRAYENDPLRSGKYVSKEAYDLLKSEHDVLQQSYSKLKTENNARIEHVNALKTASDIATEERDSSILNASKACEDVEKLKQEVYRINRIAAQKQGAIEDLGKLLAEMQGRYDILAHHVLQLGEEKTSLLEALRERQSQLDFSLAQLQMMNSNSKLLEIAQQKIRDLENELNLLKKETIDNKDKYTNELTNLLKDNDKLKNNLISSKPPNYGKNENSNNVLQVIKNFNQIKDDVNKKNSGLKFKTLESTNKKEVKKYREGTQSIEMNMKEQLNLAPLPKENIKHRGMVIRVRWHPSTGKHTFGTRFLLIDTQSGVLGWSKDNETKICSKIIGLKDIKQLAYGYASNMANYQRKFDCSKDNQTPSSGSGNEETLAAPPVGPSKGLLTIWPRIFLTCCFSLITNDNTIYDFFTSTESECFDWIIKLSRALKPYNTQGILDRYLFFAARGWTRLIEVCCTRQLTCRKLLIEGLEKADAFAANTGLGKGGGKRKRRTSVPIISKSNPALSKSKIGIFMKKKTGAKL